jgi:hypothetical protein
MTPRRDSRKHWILLCTFLLFLLPATPSMAGMLDTLSLIHAADSAAERAALAERIGSEDVRAALVSLGVDPDAAQARVDRLTDAEIADLHARIDSLPAGAGVIGVVVIVFAMFVILDALGITNIFAFVRPAR